MKMRIFKNCSSKSGFRKATDKSSWLGRWRSLPESEMRAVLVVVANIHSAAEPQPNVEGASVLDKMWWFGGENANIVGGQKRHGRVYRMAIVETGGAAFFRMLSVLERAFQFGLRRFSTVGLARDPTTIFLHLAFAVTCMTSFLSDPQSGLRWMFCSD
jgi:hypothetical protein